MQRTFSDEPIEPLNWFNESNYDKLATTSYLLRDEDLSARVPTEFGTVFAQHVIVLLKFIKIDWNGIILCDANVSVNYSDP